MGRVHNEVYSLQIGFYIALAPDIMVILERPDNGAGVIFESFHRIGGMIT